MTRVFDGQGFWKTEPKVAKGMIIAFYGTAVPTGWKLCDGTQGTPDLRDRLLTGDTAAGIGSAGGTGSPVTGMTHAGFALTNHSNHAVTQPAAHSAHGVTQPAAHSNHVATQAATHGTHATSATHTHDSHTFDAIGPPPIADILLIGPTTHSADGAHTHDAHSAHTGWGVDAHSAHTGFAVDAHSAHSGMAVDVHGAHGITQADTHIFKHRQLAWIYKQ